MMSDIHSLTTASWQIEQWISEVELQQTAYATYWNDEQHEIEKEWYVADGDYAKMERYLATTGLVTDLARAIRAAARLSGHPLRGVALDLASGTCWAAPHLLALARIDRLICVEFSRHRLLKLAPSVLAHYRVPPEKVVLALGSFYKLHLPDASIDVALLCQALHHADEPMGLLRELRRVLKPGGLALIIGEHVKPYGRAAVTHVLKSLIGRSFPPALQRRMFGRVFPPTRLWPRASELFPPDHTLGDHYYTRRQYRTMFLAEDFRMTPLRRGPNSHFQGFILR